MFGQGVFKAANYGTCKEKMIKLSILAFCTVVFTMAFQPKGEPDNFPTMLFTTALSPKGSNQNDFAVYKGKLRVPPGLVQIDPSLP